MDVSPTIQHLHGRLRSITGTDPAAGAEISETVPARRRWRLLSIRIRLVTDVTVTDRTVRLHFDDGTNILFYLNHDVVQAADLTYGYNFSQFPIAPFRHLTSVQIPIPNITLAAGYRIRTTTTNIQVGDNYSAPQLLIEEWIDP